MAFVYVSNAVSGDGLHKLYDWHDWNTTASRSAIGISPFPPTPSLWLAERFFFLQARAIVIGQLRLALLTKQFLTLSAPSKLPNRPPQSAPEYTHSQPVAAWSGIFTSVISLR